MFLFYYMFVHGLLWFVQECFIQRVREFQLSNPRL